MANRHSTLGEIRIELDTNKVRDAFASLSDVIMFEAWLDAPAKIWEGLTARQMIAAGRTEKVIDAIESIKEGVYF